MSDCVNTSRVLIDNFKNKVSDLSGEVDSGLTEAESAKSCLVEKIDNYIRIIDNSIYNIEFDINTAEKVLSQNEAALRNLEDRERDARQAVQSCESNVSAMKEAATKANSSENASLEKATSSANLNNAQSGLNSANANLSAIQNSIAELKSLNRQLDSLIRSLWNRKNSLNNAKKTLSDYERKLEENYSVFDQNCRTIKNNLYFIFQRCEALSKIIQVAAMYLDDSDTYGSEEIHIEGLNSFYNSIQSFGEKIERMKDRKSELRHGMDELLNDFSSAMTEKTDEIIAEKLAECDEFITYLGKVKENLFQAYLELKSYVSYNL